VSATLDAGRGGTPEVALVAYHLRAGRVSGWAAGAYAVPERYVDAVRRAGGAATLVLPGDGRAPKHLLERFDAVLLVGGGDVEPHRFGQEPHPTLSGLEPDRDLLEIDLLRTAAELEVPTLCICRGMQVMNVAFGGTLIQHLPDEERFGPHATPGGAHDLRHDVEVRTGSRVALAAGAERLACSSQHHQGVDRIGDGLVPTGWTDDGLVEALELEGPGWMVGVQWHPEDTAAADPVQQGLFDALIDQAR
jgi:putative glutamine amidotransferase